MARLREHLGAKGEPLFAVDPKGRVEVFAGGIDLEPGAGWSVIALVDAGVEDLPPVAAAQVGGEQTSG